MWRLQAAENKIMKSAENRVKHVFFLLAIWVAAVTLRMIYLQGIFPHIPVNQEKLKDTEYITSHQVKQYDEEQDKKSRLRSFFTWIRKSALTEEEEKEYERTLSRRNKKYVHLMTYVRNEIDRTTHPMETVRHERGKIYSSDGTLIAGNEIVYDIRLNRDKFPPDPEKRDELIDKTLKILGIDRSYRLNRKSATVGERLASSQKGIPLSSADREQFAKLKSLKTREKFDAINYNPRISRSHPGNIAVDTIGVANYRGNDMRNEFTGLSGLEKKYEEYLGATEEEIDILETPELALNGTDENAPRDLYVTIDRNFQKAAQEIMAAWEDKVHPDAGMMIVQECDTGRILAMATSKPTPGQNLFVENAYEPGSTLKTVAFAALLDSKSATENDIIHVGAGKSEPWKLKKFWIRDDHNHPEEPDLSLRRVIETSSNIGTGKFVLTKMNAARFYPYLEALGFGRRTGIELPGESAGIMRPLKKYKEDVTLFVTISYGHGISVTPVQLVTAYSALINGGLYNRPSIVDRVAYRNGETDFIPEKEDPVRVISEETSAKVRKVLRGVMDNGTGKDTKIKGYILAGKTGTAMRTKKRGGGYIEGSNNALFAGFFPYKKPKYTILVIFDHPEKKLHGFGAQSALPAYANMVRKIIEIKHIPADI